MNLLYCYGVIGEHHLLPITGFGKVGVVQYKQIYALVSHVSEEQFSQEAINRHIKDMAWLTAHAPVHEKVVNAYVHTTTVVPMKFCTVFRSEKSLLSMLEQHYAHFRTNLDFLHGKTEMSVKIFLDTKKARETMIALSPEIQSSLTQAKQLTPGKSYFALKKIDDAIDAELQSLLAQECTAIETCLSQQSVEVKNKQLLEHQKRTMVLHCACLVNTTAIKQFSSALTTLNYKVSIVEITGPFAAYNFIQ